MLKVSDMTDKGRKLLVAVADLLEGRLTQGAYSRNKHGQPCPPGIPGALCWCLLGGIHRAATDTGLFALDSQRLVAEDLLKCPEAREVMRAMSGYIVKTYPEAADVDHGALSGISVEQLRVIWFNDRANARMPEDRVPVMLAVLKKEALECANSMR